VTHAMLRRLTSWRCIIIIYYEPTIGCMPSRVSWCRGWCV